MKNQQTIQYAVMCLQELDSHPSEFLSSHDISRSQGIPLTYCNVILEQFTQAGLIEASGSKHYRLLVPVEELKVLEILQALSTPVRAQPAFKLLFVAQKIAIRKTVETLRWSQALETFPSDGGFARS